MTEKSRKPEELTDDELQEAHGEALPDREQMSVIKPEPYPTLPVEPSPEFTTQPIPYETE